MKISNHTRNPNMTRTNSASTSILAKLLAREDLTVVFSPSADTAYFNGATRTLTLPVWENMSDELTEMLVAHEVGHALHTPAGEKPVLDAIRSIDPNMSAEAKTYINIAEDARIEQEIKSEFPGARKSFAMGYRDLLGRDMFDLNAIPMEERTLCDRINIHAKVGFSVEVPFDDYEREILDAVMGAKSWEEVVENAKAMWEYDGTIGRKKIEDAKSQNPSGAPGSAGDAGDSEDDGDGETENDGSTDSEDAQDGDAKNSEGGNTGEKTETKGKAKAQKAEDTDEDGEKKDGQVSVRAESVPEFAAPAAPASAKAIEKGLDSLRNRHQSERMYGVLPTPNLSEEDGIIVSYKKVQEHLGAWLTENVRSADCRAIADRAYSMFCHENDKQVNLMVREFERRRAAATHRRNRVGNRGVINVNRLHSYKFSEDIFKTYNIAKDGKSHGMVMFVDWSSSMSSVIGDTVNQMLSLATFCRKARIPFEVYAFSSQDPRIVRGNYDHASADRNPKFWSRNPNDLNAFGFTLINLVSSRMSKMEFEAMTKTLIAFTDLLGGNEFATRAARELTGSSYRSSNYRWGYTSTSQTYGLGGTPLHSAILAAHEILPKFRAETKTQVLTTIFLTDGEGTDSVLSRRWDENGKEDCNPTTGDGTRNSYSAPVYARHRNSREYFAVGYSNEMQVSLIESLRRTTGSRILGFNIVHTAWNRMIRTRNGHTAIDWTIRKYFQPTDHTIPFDDAAVVPIIQKAESEGVLTIPYSNGKITSANPYDELYILSGKSMSMSDGDEMDRLDEKATLTKIRNAFLKQNTTGRKSRVFLNRFIPMIAESL